MIPLIFLVILFSRISAGKLGYIPSFEDLENPETNQATRIYSADGKLIGNYFFENRVNVTYEELSPELIKALIATEDIRFENHAGIDARAILRAISGVFSETDKGGGSTITQQLAKLLYHDPAKNFYDRLKQKLNEWVIAVMLEKRYTKKEIITLYFNRFDFLNLAVGIHSAAKIYFNTTPDSLNTQQSAMLIGMAKNPARYNPLRRPELTLERRNVVLSQMVKYNLLSKNEYDSLIELPLNVKYQKVDHKLGASPYFREYLRLMMTAKEPERKDYPSFQMDKFEEDSLRWLEDPLYGWCNKNTKLNGESYDIYTDGLRIYSTIDTRMQEYAEQSVRKHLGGELQDLFFKECKRKKYPPFSWRLKPEDIDRIMKASMKRSQRYRNLKKQGFSYDSIVEVFNKPVKMTVFSWKGDIDTVMSPLDSIRYYKFFLHAGFISMEPRTGHVKAYVGDIDFRYFQYDMVSLGKRQVGSTFKPFLYVSVIQDKNYSPCHKIVNIPYAIKLPEGQYPPYWYPTFSGAGFLEELVGKLISLRSGLAYSLNQISAWALRETSPEEAVKYAYAMGVRSKIAPVPSNCVGAAEVYLADMVAAYCTFVNRGYYTPPIFVTRIEDNSGNIIDAFTPQRQYAINEETAMVLLFMMQGVVDYGTSVRLRYQYNLHNDIAGKTGTTNNNSDGWFIGITPNLVSGAWVGGEERSIHFYSTQYGQGANMALPIWAYYMKKIYADSTLNKKYSPKDEFYIPENKLSIEIDCEEYYKAHPELIECEEEEKFNF